MGIRDGRQPGETPREAVYRWGLETVKVRIESTCTYDNLRLHDIVTTALEEGLKDEDTK